jgi:hypothetical protein
MCFHRSRYWRERAEERRTERTWDLFYRETQPSDPPITVAQRDEPESPGDRERDEVPVGAER